MDDLYTQFPDLARLPMYIGMVPFSNHCVNGDSASIKLSFYSLRNQGHEAAMNNGKWLDITEYALWAGSGVGSIASIASQQLAYTAAPLSFLLLLNLVNRRRFDQQVQQSAKASLEQLDQRLSKNLTALDRQVQTLPSFLDLASLKKTVFQRNERAIAQVQQTLSQRLASLEAHDVGQMQQDLNQLRSKSSQLTESVASVTSQLSRAANAHRVESAEVAIAQLQSDISQLQTKLALTKSPTQSIPRALQDQINHLNRRLNALPQPFDATSMRQDVDGLIKVMGDLVSRREMARLMAEVEKIRQQSQTLEQTVVPMRMTNSIMRKQMDTLSSWLSLKNEQGEPSFSLRVPEQAVLEELKGTIATLEHRLNSLPSGTDLTQIHAEMQTTANDLGKLQQQVSTVQQFTQSLDRQQKNLGDWINRLPQILDTSALQSQMKYLTTRLEWSETTLASLRTQVEAVVEGQQPPVQANAEYEWVFNLRSSDHNKLPNSRALLDDALENAQSRLIVVFPYPDHTTLDVSLVDKFKAFLDRKGHLDVGWGHLGNLHDSHTPHYIRDKSSAKSAEKRFLHTILSQLTQLKHQYPNQFRFKVLGTDENFLICDRAYGILGVHPIATTSAVFPEVAVGLRTTNSDVIKGLIDRFDNPVLGAHDAVAYYNRAITRHALGDKSGAIADYSEVVKIDPTHAIAYNNRALVRYEMGNKEGAISDSNRSLLLNPRSCVTCCNRGVVRLELGDKVGAIADFTDAIQLEAGCTIAYLQRGLARLRLDNKLGAAEDFSTLIDLDAQDAIAYFHRGTVRSTLGDQIGAIRDFKEAAWLFSAQGNQSYHQRSIEAVSKLRKRLVLSNGSVEVAERAL